LYAAFQSAGRVARLHLDDPGPPLIPLDAQLEDENEESGGQADVKYRERSGQLFQVQLDQFGSLRSFLTFGIAASGR
jgi:hypothetical protein